MKKLVSVGLFLLGMAVFSATLAPEVQFGDNAEFVSSAWNLGICHNPGYPIQTLLGNTCALWIPVGSIAQRVNYLSAVIAVVAGILLFNLVSALGAELSAAFFVAALFLFSPLFWSQATSFEVYTLDGFFVILNMFFLYNIYKTESHRKWLRLLAFSLGMGIFVHLSQVLYLPGFLAAIYFRYRRFKGIPSLLTVVVFLVFSAGILLYIPIRAVSNPAPNFSDPSTVRRFVNLVTGATHRRFMVMRIPWDEIPSRMVQYFRFCLFPGLTSAGVFIGAIGLFRLKRNSPVILAVGTWVLIANWVYAVFLNQVPFGATPFGIPAAPLFCIGIALAITQLTDRMRLRLLRAGLKSALFLSVIIPITLHWRDMDRSGDVTPYYFGRMQQEILPYNSSLLVKGDDDLFIGMYLRTVEKERPDIFWVDGTGDLRRGVIHPLESFPDEQAFLRYFTEVERKCARRSGSNIFYSWRYSPQYIPYGLDYTLPGNAIPSFSFEEKLMQVYFPQRRVSINKDFQFRRAFARVRFMQSHMYFHQGELSGAAQYFQQGMALGRDISDTLVSAGGLLMIYGQFPEAEKLLRRAMNIDPGNAAAYYTLAQLLQIEGKQEASQNLLLQYQKLSRPFFSDESQ